MSYSYIGDLNYGYSENNPFLSMLAAIDGEQEQQNPPPAAGGSQQPQQQQPVESKVKLPDFWPHAPGIWFARAELRFETSNVTSERQRFAYTVDALPFEKL
jgi:hypothetical protein